MQKKKRDLKWWGDDGGAGSAQWDFRDVDSLGDFFQALGGKQRGWREWSCWPGHLRHPFLQDVAAQTLLDRGNWEKSCMDPVVWFKTWRKIFPLCPRMINTN